MFRFAPYVLKSLLRHRSRTLLTISGSAVALFVFAIIAAAQKGLLDMTQSQQAERTLIVFQANRFCPSSSRLPEDYARTIKKIPGVREVVPIQVVVNNCRASLDLVLFHGINPGQLSRVREMTITQGSKGSFDQQTDAALVGQTLARRRGLTVGQKFTMSEITVVVQGIFKAPTPAEENLIYTHLSFLQRSKGRSAVGQATQFEVQLEREADAREIAREIDATFSNDQVPTNTRPKGVFQASVVGDLVELIGWANYLGYACVGLVLALVATTTVMAVQDRIREHAILQAIGFSGPHVFALVVGEGLIVSICGGMLGVVSALAVLWWSQPAISTEGVTIALAPSTTLAFKGIVVSVLVGMVASSIPAWGAARAEIVTALRQG